MKNVVRYTYRLRPMGAETVLTLLPQHLKAERASDNLTVGYRDIVAIWLSFRPRGAYFNGYRAKIYIRDRKTITLDDTTYATFFTQERQGKEYREFVLDLIDRVKSANPQAQIMGGRNFWMQGATLVFGAIFAGLLPFMAIHSLKSGQWLLGLAFGAFAAGFVWWTWLFVSRNRLRNLKGGVPDDLLPRV